jgi:hypothetical protein
MRRFSILGAMGLILVCAVGLAALRNANELWAGVVVLVTMALLGSALLGVIHQQGTDRAWWLGFGVFTGGYLLLSLGPWFSEHIQPTLATTQLLEYVHLHVTSAPVPHSSNLRALQNRRESLSAGLAKAKKISRSASDPALKRRQRELDSVDIQIAQIQGYPASRTAIIPSVAGAPAAPPNAWQTVLPGAANYDQFLRVGHCLFALLAGLVGAFISLHLFASRENRASPERVPSLE